MTTIEPGHGPPMASPGSLLGRRYYAPRREAVEVVE
jgi:hypothetical protein